MKVIDLLNKIANDEGIPIRLLFLGKNYEWKQDIKDYMNEDGDYLVEELETSDLNRLCEEIPLIEEDKKIKHIENYVDFANLKDDEKFDYLYEIETRIIDKLNEIGKE